MRKSELRKIIKEEIQIKNQEQKILKEFDMSFFDWITAGAGIEIGRMAVELTLTLGVMALAGIAVSVKAFKQKYNELKRERQKSAAAKKVQQWLVNQPDMKTLTKLIKDVEDSKSMDKRQRGVKEKIAELTSQRKQVGRKLYDIAKKELSREEIEYLRDTIPYLRNFG